MPDPQRPYGRPSQLDPFSTTATPTVQTKDTDPSPWRQSWQKKTAEPLNESVSNRAATPRESSKGALPDIAPDPVEQGAGHLTRRQCQDKYSSISHYSPDPAEQSAGNLRRLIQEKIAKVHCLDMAPDPAEQGAEHLLRTVLRKLVKVKRLKFYLFYLFVEFLEGCCVC